MNGRKDSNSPAWVSGLWCVGGTLSEPPVAVRHAARFDGPHKRSTIGRNVTNLYADMRPLGFDDGVRSMVQYLHLSGESVLSKGKTHTPGIDDCPIAQPADERNVRVAASQEGLSGTMDHFNEFIVWRIG